MMRPTARPKPGCALTRWTKALPSSNQTRPAVPFQEAWLSLHGKIHEVEHENVGVEGGHKGEELVEHQTAKASSAAASGTTR